MSATSLLTLILAFCKMRIGWSVCLSHHEQQVGVTEVGEGVADPPHDSTRRRRLSKREQKVEEKEKMCQKFHDALAAWNTGRYVSMRQCAEAFGVPRTSLNDMIRLNPGG